MSWGTSDAGVHHPPYLGGQPVFEDGVQHLGHGIERTGLFEGNGPAEEHAEVETSERVEAKASRGSRRRGASRRRA